MIYGHFNRNIPYNKFLTSFVTASITVVRCNIGILGSNPASGIDVCVRLSCVCVVLCLATD
jgi:hypothetical protein